MNFNPIGAHSDGATISSATVLTKPAALATGVAKLLIQALTQNVRYTLDGTTPTASKGFQLKAGDPPVIIPTGTYTVVTVIEETATAYTVGTTVEYGDKLWRNVQAHTSQLDWAPPVVPALWTTAHEAGTVPAWVQPTGQQDSYALNDLVTHAGRTWKSLAAANTYEPGVIGTWRDQSSPPLWVQPSGAVGLWQVNDLASYNGQTWRCTSANNTWPPNQFGWVLA